MSRTLLSLAVILLIGAALFYVRLQQGPVSLPAMGRLAAEQVNAATNSVEIGIVNLELTLGEQGRESGLQFRDVTVSDPSGQMLFFMPKVGVKFGLSDLVNGRFQPVRLTVIEPDAQLIRSEEGELRFGMGDGDGIALSPAGPASDSQRPFRAFVEAMVGDVAGPEALQKLTKIEIIGANLSYDDRQAGASWHTADADIDIVREADGATGVLTVDLVESGTPGAAVRISASRKTGEGDAILRAAFGEIGTREVARQLPGMEWLNVLDGSVEGLATARIDREGAVTGVNGVLIAESGQISGLGPDAAYDIAEVQFKVDPVTEEIVFDRISLAAPSLDTRLTGLATLRRDAQGDIDGLVGQLDVNGLYVNLPDVFADALTFDDGQISFKWVFSSESIHVKGARLARGDLTFEVDGRAQAIGERWVTDVRAAARNMTVKDLVAHWPVAAATNARDWVNRNIPEADLDTMLAQMRFGEGEPYLSLDFDFSGLSSTYIRGMSPITGASGRGHMSYHDLFLNMDKGVVTPKDGGPIQLAGSSIAITDFWGEVTPADVSLNARGATAAVMALINEKPLTLVDKLGLDIARIGGQAQVIADLSFPLISDLTVEQVQAVANATLSNLEMPFKIADGRTADIRSQRLSLRADTRSMRVSGAITANGAPANIDWQENYGSGKSGRELDLKGVTSPALMALVGGDALPMDGAAAFGLTLRQSADGPLDFALDADLKNAEIRVSELNWTKPKGAGGRVRAKGRIGEALSISSFILDTGSLTATGAVDLAANGDLRRARLERLVLPGKADVSAEIAPGSDNVLEVAITGGSLDISDQFEDDGGEDEASDPVRISLDLDRLKLSEKISLSVVRGSFEQDGRGGLSGSLTGAVAPGASVEIAIDQPAEGAGALSLTSSNAGATLSATDLYRGAEGGKLFLSATIGEEGQPDLSGRIRIEDVVVRSQATFRDVLRDGGLDDAQEEVSSSGIGFRKIWIPFSYDDGVITLTDAIASSSALALKVSGTVNESSEQLDMVGVLSPAYGLTGVLDEVPILGQILSGGEGEGILAMTFTVDGPLRDPEFSVNPLSILTPGFLRKIFSGSRKQTPEQAEAFARRIRAGGER